MAASIVSGKISLKASQPVRGQKTLETWTNISIFHFHAENKIYDRYTSVANKSHEDNK